MMFPWLEEREQSPPPIPFLLDFLSLSTYDFTRYYSHLIYPGLTSLHILYPHTSPSLLTRRPRHSSIGGSNATSTDEDLIPVRSSKWATSMPS
ncbi:hypothetical protein OPV22_013765 [Ensete ventricosum]|uniref:Uncharacterized protein n=1 Tax=Ensete ventricosum TaxID=4639 RepID=A0AAV8R1P9_ENSVE|nr:hypothetical protein OPV22_013765 [Ensete ventricosum]